MKTPKIDLDELKRMKEQNFKEKLTFIDQYADHVKKTSNKTWSSEQENLIEQHVRRLRG